MSGSTSAREPNILFGTRRRFDLCSVVSLCRTPSLWRANRRSKYIIFVVHGRSNIPFFSHSLPRDLLVSFKLSSSVSFTTLIDLEKGGKDGEKGNLQCRIQGFLSLCFLSKEALLIPSDDLIRDWSIASYCINFPPSRSFTRRLKLMDVSRFVSHQVCCIRFKRDWITETGGRQAAALLAFSASFFLFCF